MKRQNKEFYVQFGCGFSAPENWRNFDSSPTLRFERLPIIGRLYSRNGVRFPRNVEYGDIVRGLPLPPGSCAAVYASHVLEHLSLEDFHIALKNTFRLLQPGGRFRLVVPDLRILAARYVESEDENAAARFMMESCLGIEKRSRTLPAFFRSWLGNSAHLWMWDFDSLKQELNNVGFVSVERRFVGDNPIFADVEDASRFIDAVSVECEKQ